MSWEAWIATPLWVLATAKVVEVVLRVRIDRAILRNVRAAEEALAEGAGAGHRPDIRPDLEVAEVHPIDGPGAPPEDGGS